MKNFADVKRALVPGAVVTMIGHTWFPNGQLIGVPRTVVRSNSVSVTFAMPDGSESILRWPSSAREVTTDGDTFSIALEPWEGGSNARMTYRIG